VGLRLPTKSATSRSSVPADIATQNNIIGLLDGQEQLEEFDQVDPMHGLAARTDHG
jgi:hypothetical protein